MSGTSTYFKVGLFILIGLTLITLGAIVFGLGSYFRETVPAESYFDYSVEGLERGSKVKYRGMEIGSVTDIGLVAGAYAEADPRLQRYVLVRMNLYRKKIRNLTAAKPLETIRNEFEKGLRIRVSIQGLTGGSFLALDYLNPERNPVAAINWEPQSLFIPSAPSTFSRIEGMLNRISATMEDIDIESLTSSLGRLVSELNTIVEGAGEENLAQLTAQTLTQTRDLAARLNQIMGQPEAMDIIPDAAGTVTNMKRVTATLEGTLQEALENLRSASEVLAEVFTDPKLRKGLEDLPRVLENVGQAAEEIRMSAEVLTSTIGNLNELTISQRQRIESLLENLNAATRNLEDVSEELRRNPSSFIFSRPPEGSPLDR